MTGDHNRGFPLQFLLQVPEFHMLPVPVEAQVKGSCYSQVPACGNKIIGERIPEAPVVDHPNNKAVQVNIVQALEYHICAKG